MYPKDKILVRRITLFFFLGKELFDKGKVRRIDKGKVITKTESCLELIGELKLAWDGGYSFQTYRYMYMYCYEALDSILLSKTFYVETQWCNNMNKVKVRHVKQFQEQNYIVATDLIKVYNLLSISIELALHDLGCVLIQFSSPISIIIFKIIFIELFNNNYRSVVCVHSFIKLW